MCRYLGEHKDELGVHRLEAELDIQTDIGDMRYKDIAPGSQREARGRGQYRGGTGPKLPIVDPSPFLGCRKGKEFGDL